MKVESHPEPILAAAERAFRNAAEDVRDDAQRRAAAHSRTGRWARSIVLGEIEETADTLRTEVGSTLASARAHELGAFIEAKRAPYLVFNAGSGVRKVKSVRLAPQPAVIPAGRHFPDYMDRRLTEEFR